LNEAVNLAGIKYVLANSRGVQAQLLGKTCNPFMIGNSDLSESESVTAGVLGPSLGGQIRIMKRFD